MKLSFKISLVIGTISIVISSAVAGISYYFQLDQATLQSEQLAKQIVESASRPSAIAAYLDDTELGTEIVVGLANNDLIAGAKIENAASNNSVLAGFVNTSNKTIEIPLYNPFIESDAVGLLIVYLDMEFIKKQASENSLQTAYLLVALSICIAVIVGLYVRKNLTHPLRDVAYEFGRIDTTAPEEMQAIDIRYSNKDEIASLVSKVNTIISALKEQFLSEKRLLKTTEELQRRFRLLFEQATAGIGLLDENGKIMVANPAFDELFNDATEGQSFIKYLAEPAEFQSQIEKLLRAGVHVNGQVELDLLCYKGDNKHYFHCLLSTINESRGATRENSKDLSQHLVEVVIYDVTERKEQELKTRYEADHDTLTGLLNRRAGAIRVSKQLAETNEKFPMFGLLMIDLDKFKPINDTHGHEVGDLVLKGVADNMRAILTPEKASCIRWGGDEFLVGVRMIDQAHIETLVCSLLQSIKQEFKVDETLKVSVGASIGVIVVKRTGPDSHDLDSLIARADDLMYETKQTENACDDNFTIIEV